MSTRTWVLIPVVAIAVAAFGESLPWLAVALVAILVADTAWRYRKLVKEPEDSAALAFRRTAEPGQEHPLPSWIGILITAALLTGAPLGQIFFERPWSYGLSLLAVAVAVVFSRLVVYKQPFGEHAESDSDDEEKENNASDLLIPGFFIMLLIVNKPAFYALAAAILAGDFVGKAALSRKAIRLWNRACRAASAPSLSPDG